CNVLFTMYILLCIVYNVYFAMYCLQYMFFMNCFKCTMYCLLQFVHNLLLLTMHILLGIVNNRYFGTMYCFLCMSTINNVLHCMLTMYGLQCIVYHIQCKPFVMYTGLQCMICSVLYTICDGLQCIVYGIQWFIIYGLYALSTIYNSLPYTMVHNVWVDMYCIQ
ncbi:hypothetical protein LOTGIDRAFT_136718, partial [Lottia gigantea]